MQPDGRIVAAGFASNDPFGLLVGIALSRYDTNGRLDTGFGNGGKVLTAFSGDRDGANAVAMQADGRIVVAGSAFNGGILDDSTNGDFALARYAAITEPDFKLAIDPEPVNVARGQKIKVKVKVNRTEGFAGEVTITAPDAEGSPS